MYLTEIAASIVASINASSPGNWGGSGGGLIVPDDVTAKFALDPFTFSSAQEVNIFIIPGYVEYNLTNKRQVKVGKDRKFITVAVTARIKAEDNTPTYDVTTEAAATKLIDLKEDLDIFLNNLSVTGAKLIDMETEPIDELEMKDSFYVTTSVLGYDSC